MAILERNTVTRIALDVREVKEAIFHYLRSKKAITGDFTELHIMFDISGYDEQLVGAEIIETIKDASKKVGEDAST